MLHVRLGPPPPAGAPGPSGLVRALEGRDGIRQSTVLGEGLRPGSLLATGRALGELVEDPAGGRRAVQWPVPERWAVVHAHGATALRAVWLASAWRGRNSRLLASPLSGDGPVAAGPWRKAELVAAPDPEIREALARSGVERRRLRRLSPGDADGHVRLYRRLADGERRRVQRVDRTPAEARERGEPGRGGRP